MNNLMRIAMDQTPQIITSVDSLRNFIVLFVYTMLVLIVISRFLYYRKEGLRNFMFTYIVSGAIIFQMCSLLSKVPLELGIALGLFAIFGILRYRTVPIKVRELTYLFLCIGVSAKNALAKDYIGIERIILSDIILMLVVAGAEYFRTNSNEVVKLVVYTNLPFLVADKEEELKNDLEQRFNLKGIKQIQKGKIDESKGTVRLRVTLDNSSREHFSDNE